MAQAALIAAIPGAAEPALISLENSGVQVPGTTSGWLAGSCVPLAGFGGIPAALLSAKVTSVAVELNFTGLTF